MYCQKCNRLLDDDINICPKCGFDNSVSLKKNTLKEHITTPKKKASKTSLVIVFLCIVVIGLTILLLKIENNNNNKPIETPVENEKIELNNTFTYKELEIKYPDKWGSSTGTIFYKEYAKINITFRTITQESYNETLDINDCLDYNFTNIDAKTFANDNSYSYVFTNNNNYYLITVNYANNQMFTKEIQKEINDILSTLKIKR